MARALWACGLLLVAVSGCDSGRATVTGRVTYDDGTPVPSGTVIAEATVDGKLVGVQAAIQSDGSFAWGGDRVGDGRCPASTRCW